MFSDLAFERLTLLKFESLQCLLANLRDTFVRNGTGLGVVSSESCAGQRTEQAMKCPNSVNERKPDLLWRPLACSPARSNAVAADGSFRGGL